MLIIDILIMGVMGCIGVNVVKYMVKFGYNVWVFVLFDDLEVEKISFLGIELILGDIILFEDVWCVVEGTNVIFYLGVAF